jgi:hypothetical protein
VRSSSPTGYGDNDDPRARLLGLAGYNEAVLADITKQSMEKKLALLSAKKVQYFAYEGEVGDERVDEDGRLQLEAAKALDEVIGVKAPPAKQTITVVHKVELPAWMLPDGQQETIIEVGGSVT